MLQNSVEEVLAYCMEDRESDKKSSTEFTARMRWHGTVERCKSCIGSVIIQNRLSSNLLGQFDQARNEKSGVKLKAAGTGFIALVQAFVLKPSPYSHLGGWKGYSLWTNC